MSGTNTPAYFAQPLDSKKVFITHDSRVLDKNETLFFVVAALDQRSTYLDLAKFSSLV